MMLQTEDLRHRSVSISSALQRRSVECKSGPTVSAIWIDQSEKVIPRTGNVQFQPAGGFIRPAGHEVRENSLVIFKPAWCVDDQLFMPTGMERTGHAQLFDNCDLPRPLGSHVERAMKKPVA